MTGGDNMKKYNDATICELYKIYGKCHIVAEKYGCSDETVRRALIKYNIPRVVPKIKKPKKKAIEQSEINSIIESYYNSNKTIQDLSKEYKRAQCTISKIIKTYGHGVKLYESNRPKISDEQLKEESKVLDSRTIAIKHNMSEERVFRRAKRLGITLKTNNIGGHWEQRARRYGSNVFDSSITLKNVREKYSDICQICGLPVDDNDIENGHIKRMYPTVDHIIPLSKGGTHTWNNVQLAHMHCNAGKCDRISKGNIHGKKGKEVWT